MVVIATGGRQVAGFARTDAQESWPRGNPELRSDLRPRLRLRRRQVLPAQGLIHIMGDGSEGAAQTSDLLMRIQRIGVQGVSYSEGPSQLPGHFPCVLHIKV